MLFWWLLGLCSAQYVLTLFLSPSTPSDLVHSLPGALSQSTSVAVVFLSTLTPHHCTAKPAAVWLDATYDSLHTLALREVAAEQDIPILVIGGTGGNALHVSARDLAWELGRLVRKFAWGTVTLVAETSLEGVEIQAELQAEAVLVQSYLVPSDSSLEMITSLLTKEIKVRSSPVIVCAAAPQTCSYLLQAAQQANMIKEGYAYIFLHPPGVLQAPAVPGLLHVLEKGSEAAQSLSEYHALRVTYWMSLRLNTQDATTFTGAPSDDLRMSQAWNWLGDRLRLLDNLTIFPGNTTIAPVVRKPSVDLSIAWDLSNPTQASNTPYEDHFLAASLAFSEMPAFLPTHDLLWHNVTYGCTEFQEDFVRSRLSNQTSSLGVAHIGPIGSGVAMGTMQLLAEMQQSLPFLGSVNSAVALGNSTRFPYYVRTIVSNGYGATVYMTMFRYFRWKKINVLYGNETYCADFYSNVVAIAKEYQIEIVNREDLRAIDPYVTNETINNYEEHLREILGNSVRPLLCCVLLPSPAFILQALYDLGARAGDIIYFGELASDMFDGLTPGNASKAAEVALGGIHMTSATYIGAVGKAAAQSFQRQFGFSPSANSCFYYDSAFALTHTLKFLIHQGKDYENAQTFMQALRSTQFRGCSGVVAFEPTSNDRSFPGYVVMNLQGSNTAPSLVQAGSYTPTAIQLLNFTTPIIWPGGNTLIPSNILQSTLDCPFKDRDLHSFQPGLVIASIVCGVFTLLISLLTVIFYTKVWKKGVQPLTQKETLSAEDAIFMSLIVLEAFQYAALGPNYEQISELLYMIGQLLSAEFGSLVTFSQGVYWLFLDVALALCGLWFLLLLYLLLRLDAKLKGVVCIGNLGWIAWLLLPYMSGVGFTPLVSVLLDVFVCDRAVGVDPDSLTYSDSILRKDCSVQCWQGAHLYYSLGAAAGLLLYVPLAVLLRPLWQEFQSQLHIKTSSAHFSVKTIFQVLLVSVSKSLRRRNSLLHAALYFFLLSSVFLFTFKRNGFNYSRVAHWHRLSLVGTLWLSVLALLSHWLSLSPDYWLLATLLGWGVLAVFGVIYMKLYCPSMLMRPKGVDTKQLFRFAFQFTTNQETSTYVGVLNMRARTVGTEQINLIIGK